MPQNVDIKSLTDTLLPTVYFSEISIREGKLSKKRTRKQQRNKKDKLNLRERKNSKKKRLKDLSRAPNTMQGLNMHLVLG